MTEAMFKELSQVEYSESLRELTRTCQDAMKSSREKMSERYPAWDAQHDIYNQQRVKDKEDRRQMDQGKPTKMLLPLTFAQIGTLQAFFKMLFTQNSRFYELQAVSAMDFPIRESAELLLQRDLDTSGWGLVLDQFLLDLCKFGLGVTQTSWVRETVEVVEDVPQQSEQGAQFSATKVVEVVSFEGNRIFNVSPYKFFPDHRWPTRDFQKGEYCAIIEEHTKDALKQMEVDMQVAGVEHAKSPSATNKYGVEKLRLLNDYGNNRVAERCGIVSVIQIKAVPSKLFYSDGTPFGPEKKPVLMLVWLLNDERIIKLERVNVAHQRFTFEAGELFPDIHEKNNYGLAEIINDLQELVTWFVNSRVSAVSKTIDNWLVVDPKGVDLNTVESRSRVIQLKQGAAVGGGIERYVKQLTVQDTTTNHMTDAQQLMQLMQTVTGVNENAMGQYNGGRRSATEARAVIQGSAGRMTNMANNIWNGVLAPLGRQLLLNHRQGLSQETFTKVCGEERALLYPNFHQPISKLIGSYDLFVFDATTPSEKSFLAQSLQELLSIVLTNPMAAAQFNLDPAKMITEIYELRGVTGLPRFAFDPAQRQGLLAPPVEGPGGAGAGADVPPPDAGAGPPVA